MAEGSHHSGRFIDGGKMGDSPGPSPRVPAKVDGDHPPVAQVVAHDQTGRSALDTRGEPAYRLNGPQQAQVSQAVFEQEQIGVALVALDGRIQHANRALASLLHYKQKELAGKALEGLARGVERAQSVHGGDEELAGDRWTSPAVNQLARKSGETISCLVDSHAIRGENGKATHFLVFVTDARSSRDVGERNRFERELYRSQALQVLGMLAGGVAHDFNNALEVILGFASLARLRLSAADPLHEPLKIIEESARGAASLARGLLDVSKDKSDDEGDIDVRDLIKAVIAIIARTFDRKIAIEHRVDSQLPCVRGVQNRLEQAMLNLCINASDAMPQGGILALEASSERLDPVDPRLPDSNLSGQYVRVAVRDNGTGMSAEVMEQLFVPMFTTKGPSRGTGLGLVMVDRIVKEAGGFISVASKPGQGSEFSLYLPAVFSKGPRAVHPQRSDLVSGRGKILVVDDEPRVLEFLEKGLTRLGYEVVPAESGNRACEIYSGRCREIDCVLLDLIMPGMSGLDTYGRLRDINPGVRVILSSGYSSGHVKRTAVEAGSPEFLAKPYTLEELSQALQKIHQN